MGRFCWTPTLFADKDVPNVAQLQAAAGGALHCLNLLSLIPLPLDLLCCSPPTFLPSLLPPHCSGLRDDDDDNSHSSDVRPRCSLHCPRLLWAPLSAPCLFSLRDTGYRCKKVFHQLFSDHTSITLPNDRVTTTQHRL